MKRILLVVLMLLLVLPVSASALYAEVGSHTAGRLILRIDGDGPFEIYRSTDNQNFEFVATTEENIYEEFGLEASKTYWYRVRDVHGDEYLTGYTPPVVTSPMHLLTVKELKDTWVHLSWSQFYPTSLYMNGRLIQANVQGNELTVTGLEPNTEYVFYYLTPTGAKSNVVRITTPNDMNTFLGRLNKLLQDLFISDDFRIDSDNDGVADGWDPIERPLEDIKDHPLVNLPGQVGDIVGGASNNIPSGNPSDLEFEVDMGELGKVDMLGGLSAFEPQIKMLRRLLVAVLYSLALFYFIKFMIPSLRA